MSGTPVKLFNLPWHQQECYWISVYPKSGGFSAQDKDFLQGIGLQKLQGDGVAINASRAWKVVWDMLYEELAAAGMLPKIDVAVTGRDSPAEAGERRAPGDIAAIADSLWLGDALLEGRVMCYLQPVVSHRDKVFGYESFARAKAPDGSIIAGDRIIAASRMLGIEYAIDRYLQVQAIKTFISSQFNGFLFVNFFPGFIHRPAVYLEGLSETVKSYGLVARHIVLDFTRSDTPRDIAHIKNVCEYGRTCGYSIALDDIQSFDSARKLLPEIRPDFVKLDMHLVHNAELLPQRDTIRKIVELAHAGNSMVIAEGVENEVMFDALRHLGADLFQGYLFSPPMPVEVVLRRNQGTA